MACDVQNEGAGRHETGAPSPIAVPAAPQVEGWPFGRDEARRRQAALGTTRVTVDIGGGVALALAAIPGGRFARGGAAVEVAPFLMGACEVSNEQYARFDAAHDSGYYAKRHAADDDVGLPLNGPRQPVVRVSWERATAFCRWLSGRTGRRFSLPTDARRCVRRRSQSGRRRLVLRPA